MVRVIPMCEFCRRVHDDQVSASGATMWMDFPSYLTRHVVPSSHIQFSNDYCSDCRRSYDILKGYGT